MGMVYKRGNIWWVQYYRRGQLFRESSRSPLKTIASTLLKKREGDIAQGKPLTIQAEKTTFEDLTELHLADLRINGKDTWRAEHYIDHLKKIFGKLLAREITSPRINEYIQARKTNGVANATINRELRGLTRMFKLAAVQTPPLVLHIPSIPHLREDNIRKGFFTEDEYRRLLEALPDHLKVPLVLGYWTGMRAGEICNLKWGHIDLNEGWVRLEPGTTKNKHGRTVPLVAEAIAALVAWKATTKMRYLDCQWVCHYRGERLQRIPKRMWSAICKQVGLEGKLFHDLRRTAVRNMVRAGIPERVAMEISGHRTRSVFDRYDIVDEADLTRAVGRLEEKANV